MIMPGVQKPHWTAPASTKASWIRWGLSGVPSPSMVMTCAPSSDGDLGEAGKHGLAVYYHRAGAALAFAVTGLLGARQAKVSRSRSSRLDCESVTTCRVTPLIVRCSFTNADLPVR